MTGSGSRGVSAGPGGAAPGSRKGVVGEAIQVATLSLTWRDAPSSIRSVAARPLEEGDWAGLVAQGARGLCEVHTCARSLWVVAAPDAAWVGALLQARLQVRLIEAGSNAPPPVMAVGTDALRHVFRVSLGLDSVVEGEADIGAQVADAFTLAASSGRLCTVLTGLWRAVVDLGATARREGVVRPGRGMGQLAAEALLRAGIAPGDRVAVVGMGNIGRQVVASVGRAGLGEPLCFNRSERPGALPLSALTAVDAVVVCTAAAGAWFEPPAGVRVVVDLGRPEQVRGSAIRLDDLLAGVGHRLDEATRARAQALAEAALEAQDARRRAHDASRVLARVQELREKHVGARLEEALSPALSELDPAARRKVLAATRKVVRRFGHEVLGVLRGEGSPDGAHAATTENRGKSL